MKKTVTSFLSLTILAATSFAQAPIVSYQQSPDFGGADFINHGVGLNGGEAQAFFVGSSDATGTAGGYDVMVTEIDPNDGSVQWAKQYGSAGTDFGRRIHVDYANEALVVVGSTNGYATEGYNDFNVMQLDPAGNVNWSKSLGTDTTDAAFAVADANDGGYLIGGYTQPGQRSSILLVKTQANGTVDWAKTIGSQWGNERMYDIRPLGSGEGYLIIGYTGLYGATWNEAAVFKISDTGDLEATFTFGGPGSTDDDARKYIEGGYDTFFIAGNTRSFGAGAQDMFLAKFSASGGLPTLLWFKTYGGASQEEFTDAILLEDGLMLMMGHTTSFGAGGDNLLMALDTASGNSMLAYTYGGSDDEWLNAVVDADGIVLGGNSASFGSDSDGYFVKLGENGETSCNIASQNITAATHTVSLSLATFGDFTSVATTLDNDITTTVAVNTMTSTANQLCLTTGITTVDNETSIQVYPVPSTDVLNVKVAENGTYFTRIYSVDGRLIMNDSFVGTTNQINVSNLNTGVYFLEVTSENGTWTSRIIKN